MYLTTLQVTVLGDAVKHHPDAWWWLKADNIDINQGLQESLQRQLSGDVDLNDGSLQKQYNDYINRIEQAQKLGLERHQVDDQLDLLLSDYTKDLKFINSGNLNFYCQI